MKAISLVTIVLLFGAASAQFGAILQPICGQLFSSAPSITGSDVLVEIAFAVALLVLTVLGLVYAIGYGFGIDSLKRFVQTEYLESFFNLAMIAFIAGGLAFAGGAISFLSSVAAIGQPSSVQVTSVSSAYSAICNNYISEGADTVMGYALEISGQITVLNIFMTSYIQVLPSGFGFDGNLLAGLQPIDAIYDIEFSFYMAMVGIFVGIPVLLWIIYNMFPWFLYAGVLLRAFPWTRAAGGAFLALFIAFYIVFPAIILPFSQYAVPGNGVAQVVCSASGGSPSCSSGTLSCLSGGTASCSGTTPTCSDGTTPTCESWSASGQMSSILNMIGFVPSLITSVVLVLFGGAYLQVEGFSAAASAFAVQIVGVVIALLISLDLVEVLGDLLGAPSMHAKNFLSKVI